MLLNCGCEFKHDMNQTRIEWARRLRRACAFSLALIAALMVVPWADKAVRTLSLLAFVLAVAATLLEPPREPLPRRRQTLFVGLLVGFLLQHWLAAVFSISGPGADMPLSKSHFLYGVPLALAITLWARTSADRRRLLRVFLLASAFWYAAELITLPLPLPWRQPYHDGRFVGWWGYHTVVGYMLLFTFCLHWSWLSFPQPGRLVWLSAGILPVLLVLMWLNKTRGMLLALALVAIPAGLLLQRRFGQPGQRAVAVAVWLFLLVPGVGWVWWSQASPERRSAGNIHFRVNAWRATRQVLARAPVHRLLFGHGSRRKIFTSAITDYGVKANPGYTDHAHNVLLQLLLEVGVLGALVFVTLVLVLIVCLFHIWGRGPPEDAAMAGAALLVILAGGAVGQSDYFLHTIPGLVFWMGVGLGISVSVTNVTQSQPTPDQHDSA